MQTDLKATAGLFAYLFARLMTSGYPSGAKIRKNRPRCSPRGGFLCSFNTITPKSPHSKPFPIPFASVLGVIQNPAKTFGIYQQWARNDHYIKIMNVRGDYPRGLALISTEQNCFLLYVSGSGNSINAIGSVNIKGTAELYYANKGLYFDIYMKNTGDIYKNELYNVNSNDFVASAVMVDIGSVLPSDAQPLTF